MNLDGAVREAQPVVPAAAWGVTGNEHFLILIESIVQNIFSYYMKSCITSEMENGKWHFASAMNANGDQIELERQTY